LYPDFYLLHQEIVAEEEGEEIVPVPPKGHIIWRDQKESNCEKKGRNGTFFEIQYLPFTPRPRLNGDLKSEAEYPSCNLKAFIE
jgi:hypothetical protein